MASWSAAVLNPPSEFPETPLTPIAGTIPPALQGTLYRNGPGRLHRGGQSMGHWFDGDGAILRVHFSQGKAWANYRYVQTPFFQRETEADRLLYDNYGTRGRWPHWGKIKNSANTSVLPWGDRLWALGEAGLPYALHPRTLETQPLNLALNPSDRFSAHPKRDPHSGDIYNFGITIGPKTQLHLYHLNPQGQLQRRSAFTLERPSLIHDFVLTQRYLVFAINPVAIALLPVVLRQKSFSEAMAWNPKWGTTLLVFHREDLSLAARHTVEPWFQWHFANGHDHQGDIELQLIRFPDFHTNRNLQEIGQGHPQTPVQGLLWHFRFHLTSGFVRENHGLSDRSSEFPITFPTVHTQPWRYTYLGVHQRPDNNPPDLLNGLARFDHQRDALEIFAQEPDCYPSEVVAVPRSPHRESGWLLTVVFNGRAQRSEVWIYDSDRLQDGPQTRLVLPQVIPPSFHGQFCQGAGASTQDDGFAMVKR